MRFPEISRIFFGVDVLYFSRFKKKVFFNLYFLRLGLKSSPGSSKIYYSYLLTFTFIFNRFMHKPFCGVHKVSRHIWPFSISCMKELITYYWVELQGQKQPSEVFSKKVFLKISQNSQRNTCARVSF